MYMLIRLPLGCFSILLYTFLYYQRKEHLHTRTSRAFQWLAVMSLAHLAAAVVTEYTVNTRERVSEAFNYVWHLIFLISLTCVCALLYYYLILYVERGSGRRQQTAKVALLAVCALGFLGEHIQPND